MITRLKTSKNVDEKLDEIKRVAKFSTKAAIARIAIGLSLRVEEDPREQLVNIVADASGFEFQRHTLTGDYDDLYKILIAQHLGRQITDEEFFPEMFNAHLERGINMLYAELKMAGNREKLIKFLLGG
jgi:DNA sulfur modification protein DndE